MTVYLVRHGMTAGNALRRYIGRTDEPLCPEGAAAARAAGEDRSVRRVYVTPLRRTRETAAILFPAAEQESAAQLAEMDFGVFENRSAGEMEDDPDYRTWVEGGCSGACPGGESRSAFVDRVCAAFASLVERERTAGAARAVFVVHGGVIRAVLSRFARPQVEYFGFEAPNCACFRAVAAAGEGEAPLTLRGVERLPGLPLETPGEESLTNKTPVI